MDRLFAIGDIHGNYLSFKSIVEQFKYKKQDTIVLLGDYIDRGQGSYEVIEYILELKTKCNLITLRGNHEQMLLWSTYDKSYFPWWMRYGGKETLESYRRNGELRYNDDSLPIFPDRHLEFYKNLLAFWENDDCIFVHAGYNESGHLDCEESLWGPLYPNKRLLKPHPSGKLVVVGHTAHQQVTYLGLAEKILALDTGSGFSDGYLSGVELCGDRVIKIFQPLA